MPDAGSPPSGPIRMRSCMHSMAARGELPAGVALGVGAGLDVLPDRLRVGPVQREEVGANSQLVADQVPGVDVGLGFSVIARGRPNGGGSRRQRR